MFRSAKSLQAPQTLERLDEHSEENSFWTPNLTGTPRSESTPPFLASNPSNPWAPRRHGHDHQSAPWDVMVRKQKGKKMARHGPYTLNTFQNKLRLIRTLGSKPPTVNRTN